jgi:hypothetical protein
MLDQNLTNLLLTVLGGALAAMGGIVTTYSTQALNNKAERKNFIREKCEEVYLLADQVKLWVENENDHWWQIYLEQFEPDNEYLQMYRKDFKPLDCPIDKLMMIVTLHLPTLRTKAAALRASVVTYQDYDHYFREQGWDAFYDDVTNVLKKEQQKLEASHKELQLLIEETVLKSWGIRESRVKSWQKKGLHLLHQFVLKIHHHPKDQAKKIEYSEHNFEIDW